MTENKKKRNISVCKYSSIGGRTENEDCCDCILDAQRNLCAIVADGLGGEGGGAKASKAALTEIVSRFQNGLASEPEDLIDWFSGANDAVLALQTPRCKMKTTLVVLQIAGTQAMWAHIGDSRLYHFVNGTYTERTFDHSVSQMAVLRGEIKEEEIRGHIDRNRLLKAIGRGEEVRAECSGKLPIDDGNAHAFLLCTDGFWENVLEHEMEDTLRASADAKGWLKAMVAILKGRAKINHDNNTAVAVIINE